jgi:ABC-type glycerol-3-phosphate transport system substrate-binding protein
MRRIVISTALGLVLAVVLAACGGTEDSAAGGAGTAAAGTDRAQAIAQNMLLAHNSGDYQAFSRDWSSPMKLMVGERA